MATSGSTAPLSPPIATTVPKDFHYETKYIVLTYLGRLPAGRRHAEFTTAEGERKHANIVQLYLFLHSVYSEDATLLTVVVFLQYEVM